MLLIAALVLLLLLCPPLYVHTDFAFLLAPFILLYYFISGSFAKRVPALRRALLQLDAVVYLTILILGSLFSLGFVGTINESPIRGNFGDAPDVSLFMRTHDKSRSLDFRYEVRLTGKPEARFWFYKGTYSSQMITGERSFDTGWYDCSDAWSPEVVRSFVKRTRISQMSRAIENRSGWMFIDYATPVFISLRCDGETYHCSNNQLASTGLEEWYGGSFDKLVRDVGNVLASDRRLASSDASEVLPVYRNRGKPAP